MSEHVSVRATGPLAGSLAVPGDKSLSHRAVLFSAMASGTSVLTGVLDSADVRSSIAAVSSLGARIEHAASLGPSLSLSVTGWGISGPHAPDEPIDCGNSGTTARLLVGVVAGWSGSVTLVGDESLSRRPMKRVTDPVQRMGAECRTTDDHLPITIVGGSLAPIEYVSPVASAQVKSAVLLAGLRASGRTVVHEPVLSRDHTERLLPVFGVDIGSDPERCASWVDGVCSLSAADVCVPGDPSSAAFIACAAALVPSSRIRIEGVALNPTRMGFARVMERMGAGIAWREDRWHGREPVGSIDVAYVDALRAVTVEASEVPSLIDEIPILALLASAARGETRFCGVGELRVKESDRLSALIQGLSVLGVTAYDHDDDFVVVGSGRLGGGVTMDSLGDHRLAMTWAVAGLVAEDPVTVQRFDAIDVSYPTFVADLVALGGPAVLP